MSRLGDIAASTILGPVRALAGEFSLSINNGPSIKATAGPLEHGRDYEPGGQQPEKRREATVETCCFARYYPLAVEEYLGNVATLGGVEMRVDRIEHADGITNVQLVAKEQAS